MRKACHGSHLLELQLGILLFEAFDLLIFLAGSRRVLLRDLGFVLLQIRDGPFQRFDFLELIL